MTYNNGKNYTTNTGEKSSCGSFAVWPIGLALFLLALGCWSMMPGNNIADLFFGNSGGEFWQDLGYALGLLE